MFPRKVTAAKSVPIPSAALEPPDPRDPGDAPVIQERPVRPDRNVVMVRPALLAPLDHRDLKAILEPPDLKE